MKTSALSYEQFRIQPFVNPQDPTVLDPLDPIPFQILWIKPLDHWIQAITSLDPNHQSIGFKQSDIWIQIFRSLEQNSIMDLNLTIIGSKLSDYWIQIFLSIGSKFFRALDSNFQSLDPKLSGHGSKLSDHRIQTFRSLDHNFLDHRIQLSDHWIKIFQIIGSKPDLTDGQCYVLQTERSPPVMSCLLPPPLATSSLLSQARIFFTFFSILDPDPHLFWSVGSGSTKVK